MADEEEPTTVADLLKEYADKQLYLEEDGIEIHIDGINKKISGKTTVRHIRQRKAKNGQI